MGHPDFRVGGRIFATLACPDTGEAMVKLPPEAQEAFIAANPGVFTPASGAWGRAGCTMVKLRDANPETVKAALAAAWERVMAQSPAAKKRKRDSAVKRKR